MIHGRTLRTLKEPSKRPSVPEVRLKVHNRFDISVTDTATGEVKQRAFAENVVTSQYYRHLGSSSIAISIGRGSGAPSVSDTSLFSLIDHLSTYAHSSDLSHRGEGYVSMTFRAMITETEYVGETITEIGLYREGVAITHAMLMDMNGNPISIAKTNTDIITFYATIFVQFQSASYDGGTVLISKNVPFWAIEYPYLYSERYTSYHLYYCDNSDLAVNAPNVISVSTYKGSIANKASDTGFKSLVKFSRMGAQQGNFPGGLFGAHFGSSHATVGYHHPLYCVILPKGLFEVSDESIGTGDGVTKNFKTAFDFPVQATVYVDGVEQLSGVTVIPDSAYTLLSYFVSLDPMSTKDNIFAYDGNTGSDHNYSSRIDFATNEEPLLYLNTRSEYAPVTSFIGDESVSALLFASNDLESWSYIGEFSSGRVRIPQEYGTHKYWKITYTESGRWYLSSVDGDNRTGYSVRFDTAPKSGSVITIDYKTPMIPKDANHVLDCALAFTFGEYSG